ncbi:MAG: molybdopterin-guanine dinucleotide biosynthesis protein B [Desulfobacteraceae bacterium]|nr:molybdopterin-guanine dinucleotide biosynthesis protein B [Desulfobacteraceae bacterium]
MIPFHIIGHPGCGKTTLIADLIKYLVEKGIRVGSMKHSAHAHELDKPGKDSYRHRQAGAVPVSMVTDTMSAIFLPRTPEYTCQKLLEDFYSHVDIVLIEGWISGPYDKIEVWRKVVGRPPLFSSIKQVKVFISDDPFGGADQKIDCFQRSDLAGVVKHMIDLAGDRK